MKLPVITHPLTKFGMASLLMAASLAGNDQDFYVKTYTPEVTATVLNQCGAQCPNLEYQFINTGTPWLDHIINKDITLALHSTNDEATKTVKDPWQTFKNSAAPSNSQYTERLTAATRQLIQENKALNKARGNRGKEIAPFIEVTATPTYLGHKGNLELFATTFYQYMGGAHGLGTTNFYVFDMANKKQLMLEDVLLPNQKDRLSQLVKAQFSEQLKAEKIDPKTHFQSWPFFLTANYSFGREGMTFLYQPYDLAFYAFGAPKVTIGYAQLSGIVKPEYLQ